MRSFHKVLVGVLFLGILAGSFLSQEARAQSFRPQKPVLHGKHWVAITGKPIAATAGATIFVQGGNVSAGSSGNGATTSASVWVSLAPTLSGARAVNV